jgi:heme exporter protein C
MKGIWWKSLSVLILLYVIIAGIGVPLKPGISSVSPTRAEAGESVTLHVTGYNTTFAGVADSIEVWLKLDDTNILSSNSLTVENDRDLSAGFAIPDSFPLSGEIHPLTLIISDPLHGSFVLPNAIFIRGCTFGKGDLNAWQDAGAMHLYELTAFRFPYRNILHETIRNVYYHVPMWFGMIIIFFASAWCSIQYIRHGRPEDDMKSQALNATGTLFGVLGLLTGMLWAHYTWGALWSWDVKQNTAAIAVLIYMAYFVLRGSLPDPDRKARVSAVYNIFGCAMLIPLLFVIPRMTASLHPGSGGNPALGEDDLDNMMRLVFYPAVIGWTLLGVWISELRYRILKLEWKRVFGN